MRMSPSRDQSAAMSIAALSRDARDLMSRLARARAESKTAHETVDRLLFDQRQQQHAFAELERAVNRERSLEADLKIHLLALQQDATTGTSRLKTRAP